jgi:hypothetical protein
MLSFLIMCSEFPMLLLAGTRYFLAFYFSVSFFPRCSILILCSVGVLNAPPAKMCALCSSGELIVSNLWLLFNYFMLYHKVFIYRTRVNVAGMKNIEICKG